MIALSIDRDRMMEAVMRERARLGWPAAAVFDPADVAASDCARMAETAETLASLLRGPAGVPAQVLVELGRDLAARALRVADVGMLCGGRP